jgi:CheY-like chemotaxis protein
MDIMMPVMDGYETMRDDQGDREVQVSDDHRRYRKGNGR